ncbi:MAG: hypothetical protein ACC726_03680 [Chloroflexota bacterium]
MADVIYQGGMKALADGDLQTAPDIRLMLVMGSFSGVSGGGEEDAINMADFAVLDEFDGIGYQEIDAANVTFTYDAVANEYQLKFDAGEFNAPAGSIAPGSGDYIGLLVKLYVDGTLANDIAVGFTQSGGFPANAANGAIAYTPDTAGALFLRAAP